jgi:hypothetical protein
MTTDKIEERDRVTFTDPTAHLPPAFPDASWNKIAERLYHNADHKIGAVLATHNPRYDNYALNCGEFDRLVKALGAGKIDAALVVAVKRDGAGRWVVQAGADAVALKTRVLDKRQAIGGAYGAFWALLLSEISGGEEVW